MSNTSTTGPSAPRDSALTIPWLARVSARRKALKAGVAAYVSSGSQRDFAMSRSTRRDFTLSPFTRRTSRMLMYLAFSGISSCVTRLKTFWFHRPLTSFTSPSRTADLGMKSVPLSIRTCSSTPWPRTLSSHSSATTTSTSIVSPSVTGSSVSSCAACKSSVSISAARLPCFCCADTGTAAASAGVFSQRRLTGAIGGSPGSSDAVACPTA